MRVAYHFTIPEPPRPELDASVQEALALRERFPGELSFLYPLRSYSRLIPSALLGLGRGAALRAVDEEADLHHLFSAGLHRITALTRLRKPLVYTLLTPPKRIPRGLASSLQGRAAFTVADPRDAQRLTSAGLMPVHLVRPGIDLERFPRVPAAAPEPFVLVAGSAPWSRRQFRTKGIDLLLEAITRRPHLRLVLLWRGVLEGEIGRRLARHPAANRVELITERADVGAVLARSHAAVVLAASPRLVKPWPHSLLEALAVGRPILVSRTLRIAGEVRQRGLGVVLDRLDLDSLLAALDRLASGYARYWDRIQSWDPEPYSLGRLVEDYGRIYENVTGGGR